MQALIVHARKKYHAGLLSNAVLTIDANGIPSNADTSSRSSKLIAKGIADQLLAEVQEKSVAQTMGAKFEQLNMEFIEDTFPYLQNLRPGKWHIAKLGNRNAIKTSSFVQYEHLDYLNQLTKENARLAASMGNALQAPAITLVPQIQTIIDELHDCGLKIVQQTGSGSAVFALSTDKKLLKKVLKQFENKYQVELARVLK
jgi:hypothetical protein